MGASAMGPGSVSQQTGNPGGQGNTGNWWGQRGVNSGGGDSNDAARKKRSLLERRPDGAGAEELRELPAKPLPQPAADVPPKSGELEVDKVRQVMRRRLLLVPRYSCEQFGDQITKKDSPTSVSSRARFRTEVAFVGDRDLYSWPGENEFGEASLPELLGFGVASSGEFAAHARGVFLSNRSELRLIGEKEVNGRAMLHFAFDVAEKWSDYWFEYPGGRLKVRYSGEFWADAASYEVESLVLRVDDPRLGTVLRKAETEIRYKEFEIAGTSAWLPSEATVDIDTRGGDRSINHYKFSNCRSFSAESTISFDTPDVVSSDPGGLVAGDPLPSGISLSIRLTTALDTETVAGDSIEGELQKKLRVGEVEFAKGSKVRGRIRRLEWFGDPQNIALVGLEFYALEASGKRVSINGTLRQLQIPGMQRTDALDLDLDRVARTRIQMAQQFALLPKGRSPIDGQFYILGSTFAIEPGLRVVWKTQ